MTVYLGKNPVGVGRIVEKKVAKEKFGATIDNFLGDVDANGNYVAPSEPAELNLAGVKRIGAGYVFNRAFYRKSNINNAVFPDLEIIDGQEAFRDAFGYSTIKSISFDKLAEISSSYACDQMCMGSSVASVSLKNLTTVSGYGACMHMFNSAPITSIDLENLTTVSGNNGCKAMFTGCSKLIVAKLNKLTDVTNTTSCEEMFRNCVNLESAELNNLTTISGKYGCKGMFINCKKLTKMSFPSLKNAVTDAFGNTSVSSQIFYTCEALTEIHFRADAQAVIESLTGYSSKFGATKATIYFDL